MSSTSRPTKILVSGASGFVASWIVHTLLERGHHVRGTVRSTKKGDYLKQHFKEHGDRFEYVIVEDVGKEGAFDDVVEGMEGVVHTASPFHLKADDPQEIIGPAVQGTTDVLESVLKFAPTVKRIVITSSSAALFDFPPLYEPPRSTTFSEKDWNTTSVKLVEEQGRDVLATHKYRASKVLAERAAWEFVEKHKAEIGWDLVTLHPPFIFGPVIHDVPSASSLNTSNAKFLALLQNYPPMSDKDLVKPSDSFIDVRDIAWAHAEALVNDAVACKSRDAAFNEGKGRVALSAGAFSWQDVVDTLTASSVALPQSTPRGVRGAGKQTVHPVLIDSTHAREVLGLKFRTHSDTFVDMLENFREKGWVK